MRSSLLSSLFIETTADVSQYEHLGTQTNMNQRQRWRACAFLDIDNRRDSTTDFPERPTRIV
jgi:hypothetical protein